jgi:hypothetical protein
MFVVQWQDKTGAKHVSARFSSWLAAAQFRSGLVIEGAVFAPCYARIQERKRVQATEVTLSAAALFVLFGILA